MVKTKKKLVDKGTARQGSIQLNKNTHTCVATDVFVSMYTNLLNLHIYMQILLPISPS